MFMCVTHKNMSPYFVTFELIHHYTFIQFLCRDIAKLAI